MENRQNEANLIKVPLCIMGTAMAIGGAYMANPGMIYWGSDLVVSSLTGKGIADHVLQTAMHGTRFVTGLLGDENAIFDEDFIENFAFLHLFSNRGWDLIAQEGLSNLMSMGLNGIAGRLARATGGAAKGATGYLAKLAQHQFMGSVNSILARKVGEKVVMAKGSQITRMMALKLVAEGIQEYCELVGEVVMEMAFDTMLSENKAARPLGGATVFLMSMSLSIAVSTALSAMGKSGLQVVDGTVTPRIARSWSGAARASLLTVSVSLAVAQAIMRIPVLVFNAA